jgi:hypothetical protein
LPGDPCSGLTKQKIVELYREADAILNICGAQEFNDDLLQSNRVLYVESDPGVEQIKVDQGEPSPIEYLSKHLALFTFGENVGNAEFPVPLHQFQWLPTRQPIVADLWKTDAPPSRSALLTSVANWNTDGRKDIEWRGKHYLWSKSLDCLKFIEAPWRAGETFELVTDIPDSAIRERFLHQGWQFTSPAQMSIDHLLYRNYLRGSKGGVYRREGSIRASEHRLV